MKTLPTVLEYLDALADLLLRVVAIAFCWAIVWEAVGVLVMAALSL
ncbi:hypothetical protein [Nonomuraea sp. NPDC049784]